MNECIGKFERIQPIFSYTKEQNEKMIIQFEEDMRFLSVNLLSDMIIKFDDHIQSYHTILRSSDDFSTEIL